MTLRLAFDHLLNYDAGQTGITIDVALGLGSDNVSCKANWIPARPFVFLPEKLAKTWDAELKTASNNRSAR